MLLREPAVLRTGGGTDSDGNPIPTVDDPIRARGGPLTTEESFARVAAHRRSLPDDFRVADDTGSGVRR